MISFKRILLGSLVLVFWANIGFSQDETALEIPQDIVSHFDQHFAKAKDVKWKRTKKGKYEVDFKLKGDKTEVKYLETGEWFYTESRIKNNALPDKIKKYLATEYKDFEVTKIEFKDKENEENDIYKVKLERDEDEAKLQFDLDGQIKEKIEKIGNRTYHSVY